MEAAEVLFSGFFYINMFNSELYKQHLKTSNFDNIKYFDELDSTNSKALELSKSNIANGTVVITDHQTAGRGRQSKKWFSLPGKSLTFSVILFPDCSIDQINRYSIVAGLAVSDSLNELNILTQLKWPNDILIDGKKVGGILCESKIQNNYIKTLVIGIGININEERTDFPSELQLSSTSLFIELGKAQDREQFLASVINNLEVRLNQFTSFNDQIEDWQNRCVHLNKVTKFNYNNKVIKGRFMELTESGEAKILIDGKVQVFNSGEVVKP